MGLKGMVLEYIKWAVIGYFSILIFYGYIRYWLEEYKRHILNYALVHDPKWEIIIKKWEMDFQKFSASHIISQRYLDNFRGNLDDFLDRTKRDILIRLILSIDSQFIEWDEIESSNYDQWKYDIGKEYRASIYVGKWRN